MSGTAFKTLNFLDSGNLKTNIFNPFPDFENHVNSQHSSALILNSLPNFFSCSGLDPAMPMFMSRDRDHRLDSEDAKFVDVIHTSAFVQGQYSRSGHVDFYMNGGIEQPGCWNASSK